MIDCRLITQFKDLSLGDLSASLKEIDIIPDLEPAGVKLRIQQREPDSVFLVKVEYLRTIYTFDLA